MKTFYAPDRKAWRDWLLKNHDKESEIWLIRYHKSSKTPSVSYEESVEEALCFGWIDSLHRSRDKESSIQKFGPRKPKSNWAESNRSRAKQLIKEGLMTEAGREVLPLDLD